MTDADQISAANGSPGMAPLPGAAGLPPAGAARARSRRTRRVLAGVGAVLAVAGGGAAIYRGQKQEVAVVAPPMPTESQAPSVDDVIGKLETGLKKEPDDADGWRMLGWSYFQTGRYAEAAGALRKATKLDPEHAQTYSFLGEALVLASKREGRISPEARAAFDKAIKLDPKDARARYFRAVALDLSGQHRRAISAWFALLKETPPDAPYADDIRAVIRTVGAKHKIEVEKRIAQVRYTPPPPPVDATLPKKGAHGIPAPSSGEMKAAHEVPKDH